MNHLIRKLTAGGAAIWMAAGFFAASPAFAAPNFLLQERIQRCGVLTAGVFAAENKTAGSSAVPNAAAYLQLDLLNVEITDSTLEKWLQESGLAVIKSYAPTVFPDVTAEEIIAYKIGKPVKVFRFAEKKGQNGVPEIIESAIRVAPISDNDGNAVGVIQVELDKENPNTRQVIADVKLGQRLLPPPANSQQRPDPETLIYDQPLKAWFAVKDKSIEAASQSGESVVLGSVPLDVFFQQRKGIISGGATAASIEQQAETLPQAADYRHPWFMIVVLALMLLLFVSSIAWLIWESRFEHLRKHKKANMLWEWATGHLRIVRFGDKDAQQRKVKFSESGGKVTLYENR